MAKKGKKQEQIKPLRYNDYSLIFLIIFLLCFGLVMLYSISSYYSFTNYKGNASYVVVKQGKVILAGLVGMTILAFIPYDFWMRFAGLAYFVGAGLCILVNFIGDEAKGQSRWIEIGSFRFQPSELAKIAIILFLATIIYKRPRCLERGVDIFKITLFTVPIILAVLVNNLSTAIIMAGIVFCMMFVASPKSKYFIITAAVVVIVAVLVVLYVANQETTGDYRLERIQIWLNTETHPKGYQTLQGLYAIGSGGLFGKGLGESMQKLGFIPEPHNDMIFTVICEELGLFGAMCVIILFVLVLWRMMIIANNASDIFGSMIVVGVMSHIAIQVILNIAVVTNFFPNTGISLPFISYGGTAILCLLGEIGLVLSVARGIKLES